VSKQQPSDPIREEAQRLVSAALAAAAMAAGQTGNRFATGSAECCVCPICRVIAAMRDPDAELAGRLAAGAGDLAVGVASMLRSLATPTTQRAWSTDGYGDARDDGDEWHAATTGEPAQKPPTPPTATAPMAKSPPAKKAMAKKATAKKAVKKAAKKAAKAEDE
jgi:hypothetical protein